MLNIGRSESVLQKKTITQYRVQAEFIVGDIGVKVECLFLF